MTMGWRRENSSQIGIWFVWWSKFDILLNVAQNRMLVTKSESPECPLHDDMLVCSHRIPSGPAVGPACQNADIAGTRRVALGSGRDRHFIGGVTGLRDCCVLGGLAVI